MVDQTVCFRNGAVSVVQETTFLGNTRSINETIVSSDTTSFPSISKLSGTAQNQKGLVSVNESGQSAAPCDFSRLLRYPRSVKQREVEKLQHVLI